MKPKILFAVQGEGRGHMTQAISLRQLLERNGFEVCGVVVGTSTRREIPAYFLKQFEGIPVERLQSPNFVTKKNRGIHIAATVWQNLLRLRTYLRSARKLRTLVESRQPDLIVNFYEPLVAIYARTVRHRPPIVCIAHQYLGGHTEFTYPPRHFFDRIFLDSYTRFTATGAERLLALSFYPLVNEPKKNIFVVPPLLRREVKQQTITQQNYFLCYLLNAGYRSDLENWHKANRDVQLHVFTDLVSDKEEIQLHENLYFHRLSDTRFLEMMAGCSGLISSAGFESICEAMYLGKPALMVPVEGHFEQLCNAHDGKRAGAGIFASRFDIGKFMEWLPSYSNRTQEFREWETQAERLFVMHVREVLSMRIKQDEPVAAIPA